MKKLLALLLIPSLAFADLISSSGGGTSLPLPAGDGNYIQNRATVQSNAAFFLSSGTISQIYGSGTNVIDYFPSSNNICRMSNLGLRCINNGTVSAPAGASIQGDGNAANNVAGILGAQNGGIGAGTFYGTEGTAVDGGSGAHTLYAVYGAASGTSQNAAAIQYGGYFTAAGTFSNYGLYMNAGKFGLNPEAAPANLTTGDFYYDSSTQALTGVISGATETMDGTLWTMTVSSSINTTAVEGVIVSSSVFGAGNQMGIGTTLLPANFLTFGKTIYGVISGTYTTTGTPSLDIKVKLGGTTILDTGIVTQVAVTGTDVFTLNFIITCRGTGSSGTVMASGQTVQNTNTIGTTGMDLNSTSTTINTTIAEHLTVTVTWGASSASNNLTFTNGFLQVKN